MKSFGSFWKSKGFKPWFLTSAIAIVLLSVITLVLTFQPFLYQTVNQVLGGETRRLVEGDPSKYMRYTSDYASEDDTKQAMLAAANALNEDIVAEGITLLKNETLANGRKSLPLNKKSKITVFGKNSVNLVLGGSGSNAGSSGSSGSKNLYDSLTSAGFECNPAMKTFYENDAQSGAARPAMPDMGVTLTGFPTAETPADKYTESLRSTYGSYGDAALVVISRIGGEGYDLPRTMFWDGSSYENWSAEEGKRQVIPGAESADDHYLELDKNETAMLKEACKYFDNVVLIINSASPLELGFLDDPSDPAYNANLKSALWVGTPGKTGIMALGSVLNGDVNPSGRTVDTYPRDFTQDPTWANFGNNRAYNGNRYWTKNQDGSQNLRSAYFVEYEEGIYVGYRYWETRGYTEAEVGNDDWYKKNVIYPFGYGQSYTEFEWELVETNYEGNGELPADGTIEVTVRVRNAGERAGKDVVQLYYTAPYEEGGIEKAHVVLGDFAKTETLYPESEANGKDKKNEQEIKLKLDVREMASYDYDDANGNGFKGYELEPGAYTVSLRKDAHTPVEEIGFKIGEDGYRYETEEAAEEGEDPVKIENLFDETSEYIETYLSRSDWKGTWPKTPSEQERLVTDDFIKKFSYNLNDKASDPWYSETVPEQSEKQLSYNNTEIKLYELIGKGYDDPLWDKLLDQLTVSQLAELVTRGGYRTVNIANIDKPLTIDADGPMGFALFMGDPSVYDTCYYAGECVVGATWNTDLAYDLGVMVGNEGCLGYLKGDGRPYSGWYAPAVNIHRSQFGGRNFEYYSEDGLLSAKMAVGVISGAKTKGVYTYVKHFALNEQETNRDTNGLITWANEQAMRELYFKPFEYAVKDGKTTAMMSSFNRIGYTWAGGNYDLLTRLLRGEWGFEGMVITDYNLSKYMNLDQMIRAGGDLNLSQTGGLADASSPTAVAAMRKAAKNILYTVANSNAMNGMGPGVIYTYDRPVWWVGLVAVDAAVVVACAVWGFFAIRGILKRDKRETAAAGKEPAGQDNRESKE